MDISTLVFDFDGTLASCPYDFPYMRQAVLRVARAFGVDEAALEARAGLLETIELGVQLLGGETPDGREFRMLATQSLCDIEFVAAGETILLPGVVASLARLHAAGFRMGIITRNSAAAVRRIIGETRLPIDHILSRDDVPYPKPHPDHVHRMLALLQRPPAEAIMVGDHPMDIEVGKAAGMRTVAVLTGQTDEPTLRAAEPDELYPSVVEMTHNLLAASG